MPFIGKQSTSNSQITNYTTTVGSGGQTNFTVVIEGGDETHVYLNGVLLKETTDYTVSSTQVSLVSAAAENDIVDIKVFRSFALADAVKASDGGTFSGDVTVPNLTLSSNVIKASDGGSTITLDTSDNVTIAGNLKVKDGGTIGSASDADAITISSSGAVTLSSDFVPVTPLSHRNMIINGAMNFNQRGSKTFSAGGNVSDWTLDRYRLTLDNLDQYTGTVVQHSMSSADYNTTGFSKALLLTTGTAESAVANNELLYLTQVIEAQNVQHLQYGTASAKTITLSFWVKSSVTGTFAVGLYKPDTTARVTNKTITISDTNWNKYTLTFPGDTDSGATIVNDEGPGLYVTWHLIAGSTYNDGANTSWENYTSGGWAGGHAQNGIGTTANATFYLTGVQLELGSVETPFEHKNYGDELARCQRYYQEYTVNYVFISGQSYSAGADGCTVAIVFPVQMRTTPSITTTIATDGGSNTGLTANFINRSGFMPEAVATSGTSTSRFLYFTYKASSDM